MLGQKVLWVPGSDHAGIATQVSYDLLLSQSIYMAYPLANVLKSWRICVTLPSIFQLLLFQGKHGNEMRNPFADMFAN